VCAAGWRDTYQGIDTPDRIEAVIAEYYSPDRIADEIAPRPGLGRLDRGGRGRQGGRRRGRWGDRPGGAEVFVLYLDPSRRGEGIGTRLLEAVPERHRGQGVREQWVSVEPENAKGLPFYRARGFEERGTRPAWDVDPGEGRASLRLARRLGVTSPA